MSKKIIYAVFYFVILTSQQSCKKDFLEIVPLGNLIATKTSEYDLLLNDSYLYDIANGGYQEMVLMGDELSADAAYLDQGSRFMPRLFAWQPTIYQPGDDYYILSEQLKQLYVLNKVIAEVMNSSEGTEVQKKSVLAEAKVSRAFMNFHWINVYGKPYHELTASQDPGFPIIDQPDVNRPVYERGTVQEMYAFIQKDLQEAIPDLVVKPRIVTRWSKPAGEALLAKVLMFMGEYEEALPLLGDALDIIEANGAPALYDYNVELADGGSFLPIDPVFGPNGPGNNKNDLHEAVLSKVFYNGPFVGNMMGNDGLLLTDEARSLYSAGDKRLLLYTDQTRDGSLNPGGLLRKNGVSYSRMGLQLPELYLLHAEAKARAGDLSGAVAAVEMLRSNRIDAAEAAVPVLVAADQESLIRFIIEERIREFAFEGYRWFDMRRLSVDPLFSDEEYTHTLYNQDGTTTVFTLDKPNRLVLKIHPYILNSNPDMEDNP